MSTSDLSVLFLGKRNDAHCARASEFCSKNCRDVQTYLGVWGDPLPENLDALDFDVIISYLSTLLS